MAEKRGWLVLVRRGVAIAALSLWIGAIAFYGAVVVPAGGKVLGATAQGFVTQRVTEQLNVLALIAIAALAWNTLVARRPRLVVAWLVMLAAQVALFILHPYVGALLDVTAHQVMDPDAFYTRHRIYLLVTTAQWLAAVAYGAFALAAWRAEDQFVQSR